MSSLPRTTSVVNLPLVIVEECNPREIAAWLAVAFLGAGAITDRALGEFRCVGRSLIRKRCEALEALGFLHRTKQPNGTTLYTLPSSPDSNTIPVPSGLFAQFECAGELSVWIACYRLSAAFPQQIVFTQTSIARLAKIYKLDVLRKHIYRLQVGGLLQQGTHRPVGEKSLREQAEEMPSPQDEDIQLDATPAMLWRKIVENVDDDCDWNYLGRLAEQYSWFLVGQALTITLDFKLSEKKSVPRWRAKRYFEVTLENIAERGYLPPEAPEAPEAKTKTRTVKPASVPASVPAERYDAIREALAEVCGVDLDVGSKEAIINVNRTAKRLYEAGCKHNRTPEETVEAIRYVAKWFAKNDWRGKKGDRPTPKNLTDVWGAAIAERAERKAPTTPQVGRENIVPPLEVAKLLIANIRKSRQGESRQGEN